MSTLVAVCVYNRIKNIRRWADAWGNTAKQQGDKLCVIRNHDSHTAEQHDQWQSLAPRIDYYRERHNQGYDTGAWQDLLLGRLDVPLESEFLLLATDDTIPMRQDYLAVMQKTLADPKVGVVGAELSALIRYHLRTNFFMMRMADAKQLKFPGDPVPGKAECYGFEHASDESMTNQFLGRGLQVVQVDPKSHGTYCWDLGHHGGHRWDDFWKFFPKAKQHGKEQY